MEMYDVGQTSLTTQEAYSLAELARLMGKPQALQDRCETVCFLSFSMRHDLCQDRLGTNGRNLRNDRFMQAQGTRVRGKAPLLVIQVSSCLSRACLGKRLLFESYRR